MKRKMVCLISLIMALGMASFGCGKTQSTASKSDKQDMASDQQSTADGDVIVRIAVGDSLSPVIRTAMENFNAEDNGYRIEAVTYETDSAAAGGNSSTLQTADLALQMDIIQGGTIDLVADGAFVEKNSYDVLAQKGAFADIYTFLDEDSALHRSDLNEHILTLHEMDGILYQVPLFYEARTLVSPSQYVGTKENQTMEEIKAHWENMPEGSVFLWDMSIENIYYELIQSSLGTYIDYENAVCSFDSPSFVSLLDFCGAIRKNKSVQDLDQREFLRSRGIYGLYQFHELMNEIPGDSYTLVGYPSEHGKAMLSHQADCRSAEGT